MLYSFDNCVLDTDRRELRCDRNAIPLQPQVFDLLQYLIGNRDRVVTKDDIIAAVWNGRIVSESALTTRINAARTAIGDSGGEQRLIKTFQRKGVRFVGAVREVADRTKSLEAPAQVAEVAKPVSIPAKPSIAVLPFTNMGGEPEQEHFADGMVEDIITELSRVRGFFVIARNSTFTYKGQAVDIKQVGRELGVRYVLEGSVRRIANRIRIAAQLIEVESARHVWAEKYDRLVADMFDIQDEITKAIVGTLEPEIGAAERERARLKPPTHLGAWEYYQRGMWHLLRRNRDSLKSAQKFFEEAVECDADFSAPHSGIAITSFYNITHGFTTDAAATLERLLAEASAAIALDGADAAGHSALGLGLMERRSFDKSLHEHSLAVSLSPNSAYAHWAFGYALLRANRNQEALDRFDTALRLSPRDPLSWSYLTLKAASLYRLQRYSEAAVLAQEATTHPTADAVWPHVHLAASVGQLGQFDIAASAITELCKLRPGLTISAFRNWPHNRSRPVDFLNHIAEGLKKAGLPA